jgi:hypothetical protein
MFILSDTREHKTEWDRIKKQFDVLGVRYDRCKLYCGDYQEVSNSLLVIDRKKDLQEICGNVCQQHERFQRELMRAKETGIHIVILCEHGADIKSLEDVKTWQNPRRQPRIAWVNGHRQRVVDSPNALTGEQLYKTLTTIKERYGIDFEFCTKGETGKRIIEILARGKDDKESGRS